MIKSRNLSLLSCLLIFWVLSWPLHCHAAPAEAARVSELVLKRLHLDEDYHRCTAVADGDTLTLDGLGVVRFIGVDTPEKNHPKLPEQFLAKEASLFTKSLCSGKRIRLEYDPFDEDKRGNYGRILGYLYLEDGTFVQEQLLKHGYAACYTKYPFDPERRDTFLRWEAEAKRERRGLWRDDGTRELLWILKQKQLMIRVVPSTGGTFRLQLGAWVSGRFSGNVLVDRIKRLHRAAYELGPKDLKQRLVEMGYVRKKGFAQRGPSVFVIGMAFRKWGILFENNAKPRIAEKALETEVRELFNRIRDSDPQMRRVTLSRNGYQVIPENLVLNTDPVEIADSFLMSEPIASRRPRVISWESARRFMNKRITVQGKIVRTFNSGNACFLNFHRNFTRYMSLVIFENRFSRFPAQPEKHYLNKTVQVTGKIREYEGRPEIVVESPEQIEIIHSGYVH